MSDSLILPDGDLDGDDLAFARTVRAFAQDKLAPHARRIDEEITFRHESIAELAAAGLLGGTIAPKHGGAGWNAMQLAIAHEELGAVCGNTRGFLAVQIGLVASTLESYGTDAQRQAWLGKLCGGDAIGCFALTEPEAGSDVASLRCRAEPTADGFRITGEKIWITNGGVADVALVFANADPDRGKEGITGFVIETDRPGLTREKMPGVELGHRGSDHATLRFASVEVPKSAVLGKVGGGFDAAMGGLHAGRLSVAAGAVGIHRAALANAVDFTKQRQQFGRPIAKFQMVQERLADMTVELLAARQLVWRCARRRMRGIEVAGDLAAAKLYATEAAARAADQAVILHGGRGYSSAYPVERLLRDVMGLRIYEGTTLIQKAILAREVTR